MDKYQEYSKYENPDVLISFSDMNLFINQNVKKFLWSHSVQNFEIYSKNIIFLFKQTYNYT